MSRSRLPVVIVAAVLSLVAGACGDDTGGGDAGPAAGVGDTSGSSDGEGDGDVATVLRTRFAVDPAIFDPILLSNSAELASGLILFEPLVQPAVDGNGNVNVLAEQFEVAEDGLSIDFTLKPGIQFHRGFGELTADDVQFSLERAAGRLEGAEASGIAPFYIALDRVEVTGTHSGRILMTEPSVTMVEQALPLTLISSRAAYEELGPEEFARNPVGTGPYELGEVVPGERVQFTRFEEYSGASPYVPEQRFEEMIFHVITEDNAAELAYEAGDLDVLAPVRAASVSRFEGIEGTEVTGYSTMTYRWIGMNTADPALSNRDLREAIIAAIDVDSIIAATSEGEDTRATALVAPSSPIGYWADAPVHEQDLEHAQELVQQVPEDQRSLRFTIADDELSRTVAQVAQQNLEDAGLTVAIETLDAASFFVADETNRSRQLFYTEFGINYREPTQELLWFTCDEIDSWNYMYWCDERYTQLFREAQQELDPDAREAMYVEMQELMEEAAHSVWVSHPTLFIAARTDTVDVVVDPAGTVYFQALTPL